ncbi:hypothetical protein ACQKM9_17280 [Viridibacillus sp. NPDC093762]|uniref:hypothetical protein n=1 Tax=Viridibacillus sp. NPDC093762 TaxID=3390720 RepID=UPI003D06D0DE
MKNKILIYGVAIIIVTLFLSSYFLGKEKAQPKEEPDNTVSVSTTDLNQEKKMDDKEKKDEESYSEDKVKVEAEEDTELTNDSFNYKKQYYKKFGKKDVTWVQKTAEQIIEMYLNNRVDIKDYEKYMSAELVQAMLDEPEADESVKRIIKFGENRLLPTTVENEIQMEIEVSWRLKSKGVVSDGRSTLVYINFAKENDRWYAKDMKMV